MGASTREIAREAGVADGTLYVHFTDRIDLFIALIQEHLPPYTEPLRRLNGLVGRRTVRANLAEVFEGALTWYEQVLPLSGALAADRELFDALHKRLMERGEGPHLAIKTLESYLKAEQRLGRVNAKCDVRASAILLFGAASHWISISDWIGNHIQYTREELTKDILKSLMAGLEPATSKTGAKRKQA
jgi:AcrR family transcriptional regulator